MNVNTGSVQIDLLQGIEFNGLTLSFSLGH
jgi:hypothetical protein